MKTKKAIAALASFAFCAGGATAQLLPAPAPCPTLSGPCASARAVRGSVMYSLDGGITWSPLTAGTVLRPGPLTVIQTGAGSGVDFFLDARGPIVRVTESNSIRLAKITGEAVAGEMLVEARLEVRNGRTIGIGKKLSGL